MSKKNFRGHFNNLILLVLAGGFFWIGADFFEYEISKMQNKLLIWINTPVWLDLTTSGIMILGSILIISMVVLIYYKRLENRNWLWAVVFIQTISLILLSGFLGYNKFIWILFPNTFSIFN